MKKKNASLDWKSGIVNGLNYDSILLVNDLDF